MDDDLATIFDQKPADVRLYFISDSCHSGSGRQSSRQTRSPTIAALNQFSRL